MVRIAFLCCLLPAGVLAADWRTVVDGVATWNSNASNATRTSDRIDAVETTSSVSAQTRRSINASDAWLLAGTLSVEVWPSDDEFNTVVPGVGVDWQRKLGLGAFAPVLSIGATLQGRVARDRDQQGVAGALVAAWRQRWSESVSCRTALTLSRTDARGTVYDRTAAELGAEVRRDVNERFGVFVLVSLRSGDVVSYATPPRPDLVSLARTRLAVRAFDRSLVVYSVQATTWSARFGADWSIADRTNLTGGYELRVAERSVLRYLNHLVSLSVVHQF